MRAALLLLLSGALASAQTVPASYWAMDVNTVGTAAPNIPTAPNPSRPFGVLRVHDNSSDLTDIFGNAATSTCNTTTHVYTTCSWAALDHWASLAATGKYVLMYTLHKTPNFAGAFTSSPPNDAALTAMMDAIRNRAGCTAVKLTGCIKFWEIWNEPNNDGKTLSTTSSGVPYWSGSLENLVHVARIVHDEVKTPANGGVNGVDPTAVVIGPGTAGFGDYTNLPGGTVTMSGVCAHWGNGNQAPEAFICEFLRRTGSGTGDQPGKAYIDAVSTHSYPNGGGAGGTLATISEAGLVSHLGATKTAMTDNGVTLCAHGVVGKGGGACSNLFSTEDGWGQVTVSLVGYPRIGPTTNSSQISGTGQSGSWNTDQAAFLFKRFQLMWSLGLDLSVWYGWDFQNGWGTLWCTTNNVNNGCTPGPFPYRENAANTYGSMQQWMLGKTISGTCAEDGNATWTCNWTGPYYYKAKSVWNSAQTGVAMTIPGYSRQRDQYGTITAYSGSLTPNWYPVVLERVPTISRSSGGWQ